MTQVTFCVGAVTADPCGVPLRRCFWERSSCWGAEPPLHIQQHPAGVGDRLHRFDDQVPRHPRRRTSGRRDRSPSRTSSTAAGRLRAHHEPSGRADSHTSRGGNRGSTTGSKLHGHHRLRDPVRDRRHSQHSDPTLMRLRDLHCPDRRRKPGSRAHPIPDLVEVALQIGLEHVEILTVHSRRSLVGLDLPPRLPRPSAWESQTASLRALACWASPPPRTYAPRLNEPSFLIAGPFAPPPPQQAGASPLLRAGPPANIATGTQCLLVSAVGTLPLAARQYWPAGPDGRFRRSPSHVPCQSRRPGSRRLHAGHHLANSSGHPPSSSRGNNQTPRFRCHLKFSALLSIWG